MIGFMLTSLKVVRMAFSCCEANRRSATRARRRLIGTRSSGRAPTGIGAAGTAAFGAAEAFCTSSFNTRPSRPEPWMLPISTPFSAASLAAAGMATPACALEAAAGAAASAAGAAWAGAAETAAASVSILAKTCCEVTVSPSFTMISTNTPACGAGTSNTTLSVSISTKISSRATASPIFLCQASRVPSVILSANTGTFTSTIIFYS